MRILHTSDWHLGRTFHGASLLDEQAEVVDRVVALAIEHAVDLVVIAGDIYDRAIPPAPAVDLFDRALAALHATGARVVAITGNHDSAVRVGVGDRVLNELGVAVRGQVARLTDPIVIDDPADGGPPVAVYLVPYLEPSLDVPLLRELAGEPEDAPPDPEPVADAPDASADAPPAEVPTAPDASADAPSATAPTPDPVEAGATPSLFDLLDLTEVPAPRPVRPAPPTVPSPTAPGPGPATDAGPPRRPTHHLATRLAAAAIRRHHATLGPARSVVVAHTFVAGGWGSESERDLSVGGSERVGVDVFAGFDVVALGHLHQPQRVDGDRVAYSGTPLPYSFSEEGHTKSVRIVELATDGTVTAEAVPLGVGRRLRTITGPLRELLDDPALAGAVEDRIRVRLTDPHLPNQAMARLRQRFPHAVELRHEPAGVDRSARAVGADLSTLRSASPLDLALRFWTEQQGAEATEAERAILERGIAATQVAPR